MFQSDLFPAGEQLPTVPLAYAVGARIAALLASGRHLTRADISGLFAESRCLDRGGARPSTTTTTRSRSVHCSGFESPHGSIWRQRARSGSAVRLARSSLPPRHVRSEAQVELQPRPHAGLADGEGRSCLCARHPTRSVRRQWCPCAVGQRSERLLVLNEIDPETRQLGQHLPWPRLPRMTGN